MLDRKLVRDGRRIGFGGVSWHLAEDRVGSTEYGLG